PPRHALLDQRPANCLPRLTRRLHSRGLVGRNADPLLADWGFWRPLARDAEKLADLPANRVDLEVARATAVDEAAGNTVVGHESWDIDLDELPLRRRRRDVIPQVPGADDMHRERQDVAAGEPSQMLIDGARLPARIGKDRAIGHGL